MSFRTPESLREELEEMEDSLNSRPDQRDENYGPDVTGYASFLDIKLEEGDDYAQRDLERLVASYAETFPDFYDEDPVGNVEDYLERFDSIEDALKPLENV